MKTYDLKLKGGLPCLLLLKDTKVDYYINNPKDVTELIDITGIKDKFEEYIYLFTLNTRNKVNGVFEVAHGNIDSCQIDIVQILIRALLSGSKRIIVMHNHPSGDISPSNDDCIFTNHVRTACDTIGIKLLDSLIVTQSGSYYSFLEEKQLN